MPYDVGSIVGRMRMDTTQWDQTRLRVVSNVRGLAASFIVAGAAMATPLVAAAKEFGKFELAMRKATSVSEVTEDQFKAMSRSAEIASVRWGEAAETQAKAFLFLGRAGLDATQQMQAFEPVILASKAMMEDLEATTEGVVNVMNAFGIGFEKTGYIADVMTQAVNASTMDLQDLMVALSYAGKPAKAFNNTIEDTAAMIGLVANEGIRGSKAGTALRFALTALASPTAEARNLLHELGVQAYNLATGQMLPFLDIMGQLENRLAGAGEQVRNYTLETLFGRRAMPAMIALFDRGSAGVKKFSDSLRDANGVTKETAEKQMNALLSRTQQVWQAFLMLARHIINTVTPAVTKLMEHVRDFVDLLVEWVDINQDVVKGMVEQWAQVAWLALKWGALLVVGSIAVSTFKAVYDIMASLTMVLVSMSKALLTLISRHWALAAEILVIGAAVYMVRILWGEFGDKMKEIMDEFVDYVRDMADKVKGYLEGMIPDTVEEKFKKFLGWVVDFKNNVNSLVSRAAGKLMENPITRPLGFAITFDQWRMNKLLGMGKQFGENMATATSAGKEGLSSAFNKTMEYLKKDLGSLKGTLFPLLGDVLGMGKDFGLGLLKDANDAMDKLLLGLIPDKLMELYNMAGMKPFMLQPHMATPWSYNTNPPAQMESGNKWKRTADTFSAAWTEALRRTAEEFTTVQEIMTAGQKDIVSGWTDAFDQLMEKGSSFVDFMDNMFQSILKAFEHMLAQMVAQNLYQSIFGTAGGKPEAGEGAGAWLGSIIRGFLRGNTPFTFPVISGGYSGNFNTDFGSGSGFTGSFGQQKVILNVTNNGAPVALKQVAQQQVGKAIVVSYVMDEIQNNPQFRDIVRGTR